MMPPKESVKGLKRSKVMHKSQIGNSNKKDKKYVLYFHDVLLTGHYRKK